MNVSLLSSCSVSLPVSLSLNTKIAVIAAPMIRTITIVRTNTGSESPDCV